jgi:hypothetical protein
VDYQGVRVEGGGVEMRRVEYPEGALVGDASRIIEGAIERAPKKSPKKRGGS